MRISKWSVDHSLFVNLLSVFILIAGAVVMFQMHRDAFPTFSFDIVQVTTRYPGAPPKEVEKLVTIPLEDEIDDVDDLEEIMSMSVENLSMVQIKIEPDAPNAAKVVRDIERAVDRVTDLPDDVEDDPVVKEIETRRSPVIEVSLSGHMPEHELQRCAEMLEERLEQIPGVSSIRRRGFRDQEIWVEVDPITLKDYYLSLDEVMDALRSKNVSIPGGTLDTSAGEFLIRTVGEFTTADEVADVIIRANDQGNWVRVRDIALVRDAYEDDDQLFKTNGTRAINLVVIKRESGDTIDIVNSIRKLIDEFKNEAPATLQMTTINDLSFYVKRRLRVLKNNGTIGLVCVTLILMVFLSRTAALMTVLGLPIAFGMTIMWMSYLGLNINLITMFGMIMVLGMLVDDAIVVSENVYRHVEMGVPVRQAAVQGTSEVIMPVTAAILTTVAAFLPLMFMEGIIGKFVRNIPMVVILALIASLFEAAVILPSHLADVIKEPDRTRGMPRTAKDTAWFQSLARRYAGVLEWTIRHRYRLSGGLIGVLLITFMLVRSGFVPFVMFPKQLVETFFIRAEAPVGTSLEETERRVSALEELVAQLPEEELDDFITDIGTQYEDREEGFVTRGSHVGQISVYLTPPHGRDRSAREIIDWLRPQVQGVPGLAKVSFDRVRPGPPVGRAVEAEIRGEHYETLQVIADRYKAVLGGIDGVEDVDQDYKKGKGELHVVVDEEAASQSYLTVQQIARTVRTAFDGGIATTIQPVKAEEEINVRVRMPAGQRVDESAFNVLLVRNTRGDLIPLSRVVSLEHRPGISHIRHQDGMRTITVSADVNDEVTNSNAVHRQLERECGSIAQEFPGYSVHYGGEQEETKRSMRNLLRAFLLASFLIFMILASLFNSLEQPLIVMTAIPFGLAGAVWAFFFHRWPLSFMAILGMVGMCGVVVNDAIILVDCINKTRREGHARRQSIIMAGQLRLRPVILTTVTTVAGISPVAYGIGGSDPFLKPAALAITWGMIFGTALTLLVIPCMYAIIDDFGQQRGHLKPVNKAAVAETDVEALWQDTEQSGGSRQDGLRPQA